MNNLTMAGPAKRAGHWCEPWPKFISSGLAAPHSQSLEAQLLNPSCLHRSWYRWPFHVPASSILGQDRFAAAITTEKMVPLRSTVPFRSVVCLFTFLVILTATVQSRCYDSKKACDLRAVVGWCLWVSLQKLSSCVSFRKSRLEYA